MKENEKGGTCNSHIPRTVLEVIARGSNGKHTGRACLIIHTISKQTIRLNNIINKIEIDPAENISERDHCLPRLQHILPHVNPNNWQFCQLWYWTIPQPTYLRQVDGSSSCNCSQKLRASLPILHRWHNSLRWIVRTLSCEWERIEEKKQISK